MVSNIFSTSGTRPTSEQPVVESQPADTKNEAGGVAFKYEPWHALCQMAMTGFFADKYYETGKIELTRVLELAEQVGDPVKLAKLAVASRLAGYMKDMPQALLLILMKKDPALMRHIFPRVTDNGRTMRTLLQMRLSKTLGGGRGLSSALQKAFQRNILSWGVGKLLSASIGDKPSFRDVLRLARPTPENNTQRALLGWIAGTPEEKWAPASRKDLPAQVVALEAYRAAKTEDEQLQYVTYLTMSGVRWDLLTDVKGPRVWKEIARGMGHQALRMNLNTLHRHDVLKDPDMVAFVAQKLADPKEVQRSRQFPYQFMAAYMNMEDAIPYVIRNALSEAAEVACGNVPTMPGPIVIGVDVSGSMSYPVTGHRGTGTSKMRCIDVAALFGAAILRKNPDSLIVPFDHSTHDVGTFDPGDKILSLATRLAEYGGGATDCHLPISMGNRYTQEMNRAWAGAVIISDMESWVTASVPSGWFGRSRTTATLAEWDKFRQLQRKLGKFPDPKLVCINLQAYGTTQAPEREDILNLGGFSDATFHVVSSFLENDVNRFTSMVEAVEL